MVTILAIDFRQGFAQRYHGPIVYEQKQGLAGTDLHAGTNYGHKLGHCQLLWHEEFSFVQQWQVRFLAESFDDNLKWGCLLDSIVNFWFDSRLKLT